MSSADPIRQRQAMVRKLERRIACEGQLTFPAVPSMVNDYTMRCEQIFAASGRKLNDEERKQLHQILDKQLREAFTRSQRSSITVSYRAQIAGPINYFISPQHASLEQSYEGWIGTREPPFFGTEPDARVLALAKTASHPGACRILDIGAGTGRNALALARLGHPVDAVELTPQFAKLLDHTAAQESLNMRVICKDVFAAHGELRQDYGLILLSEVTSDFRTTAQLRTVFELAAHCLADDGQLLLNCFVAREHFSADEAVREFAQQVYSNFFTRDELNRAIDRLPLTLVSDENVLDYEQSNQPAKTWPPTPWYIDWVSARDVFDLSADECLLEMRWLAYKKKPA